MKKVITIPDKLYEKIKDYQENVFYHPYTTLTILTLITLGIRYLESNNKEISEKKLIKEILSLLS